MRVALSLCVTLLAVAAADAARVAHRGSKCILFFKDGYYIEGWIEQDVVYSVEGHQVVKESRGRFQMQDGARETAFANRRVKDAAKIDQTEPDKVVDLPLIPANYRSEGRMPAVRGVNETSPWYVFRGNQLRRKLKVDTAVGEKEVVLRLSELTPHYVRLDSTNFNWDAYYLTDEFGPQAVRELLLKLPPPKGKKAPDPVDARFRIYSFFVRARWYDEAARELNRIEKEFPQAKEKVAAVREKLAPLLANALSEQIERAYRAGRHDWVQKQLAAFPLDNADQTVQGRIRELKFKYETANADLKKARQFLTDLPGRVEDAAERKLFTAAAPVILAELSLDDFLPDYDPAKVRSQRLAEFIAAATSAEHARKGKVRSTASPAQLLSLAVSGWLQGKELADNKVFTARKLWQARQFVQTYLKTTDPDERRRSREAYLANRSYALGAEELAQVIRLMPPAEPATYTGTDVKEMLTPPTTGWRNGVTYLVQLPPDYHAGHAYPVLFALHEGNEKPKDMLDRVSALARDYGFIVVAPEWADALNNGGYGYTPAERAAVVDVLRELRRHYQVDSDRVSLVGYGEGATMAYDVGLSHPDLFAGIVPVSGRPQTWCYRYRHNAQYLPVYAVAGQQSGGPMVDNRKELEEMVQHGYPVLYTEYRGRGREWFPGEVPYFLRWLDRQKRARAVPELGKHAGLDREDFVSMRSTDNHFYWLSSSAIAERYCSEKKEYKAMLPAASFQGRINPGNQVHVRTHGLKQVTVWLSRDMGLDLDKPVTVHVNDRVARPPNGTTPNVATLMEDFYARGDRQRLFVARVDIDSPER